VKEEWKEEQMNVLEREIIDERKAGGGEREK
jgi:hypothetical protein